MNVDILSVKQCLLHNVDFLSFIWKDDLKLLIENIVTIISKIYPKKYRYYILTNLWIEKIIRVKKTKGEAVLFISLPMLQTYFAASMSKTEQVHKTVKINSILDILDETEDVDFAQKNFEQPLSLRDSILCLKTYHLVKHFTNKTL